MDYYVPRRQKQTECLILANGPSLLGRAWRVVPRDVVYLLGVNQSWREVPDADGHVSIDHDQFVMPGAAPYYDRLAAAGSLFHTGSGGARGVRLDRHDALEWGRYPFRKRHRGAATPTRPIPVVGQDGGVALKAGHDSGGSSAYVAAQIAAGMGFGIIWVVGLDGGEEPKKFTGEKSNCKQHFRLWKAIPDDVKGKLHVIRPSMTAEQSGLTIVDWPWGA